MLGSRYRGEWLTRERLLITIAEFADGTRSSARVGVTTAHTIIGSRNTSQSVLSTSIGSTIAPKLIGAQADDPDNLDYVYSSGDTVNILFDRPTNRAGGERSGDKAFVDELFAFSQKLAYDYSGSWLPGLLDGDSIFRITILQATCPGCTPMAGIATVRPQDRAAIRTRSGSSPRASASSPPLTGDYGKTRGPMIVSFVADDFDNGDAEYGSGDTLTITFDLATDRGGTDVRATSVNVDDMLTFSTGLGSGVIAQWYMGQLIEPTLHIPSSHTCVLSYLASQVG